MAIDNDATFETEDQAANAFLNLLDKDAGNTPSDTEGEKTKKKAADVEDNTDAEDNDDDANTTDNEDTTDDTDAEEQPSDEDGEGTAEEDEEGNKSKTTERKYADDADTYVKIKIGEDEHEVPVKDLKRLFGQEAALTKRSMEVAEHSKAAELAQAKSLAALDVLVKRAQEAANPYRNLNWASLMKDPDISAEDVGALQEAARTAFENESFLTGQLDNFMHEIQQQQAAATAQAARACITALTDTKSPNYIKGWDQKLYDDMRSFAVQMGANQQMVDNLVDPAAFKLIHMAMQFHKGTQKTVTHKVDKSPKKIVKSSTTSTTPSRETSKVANRQQAVANLKKSGGSMAAAEGAFLSLFGGE